MNKYVLSSAVLATFLVAAAVPVLADESPSPSPSPSASVTPGSQRDSRQEVNDARKAAQEAARASLAAKREAERKQQITRFWEKTRLRLQKLIDRETKVADKIAARIDRLEDAGRSAGDITKLRDDLVAARAKITEAQKSLDDATTEIGTLLSANAPMEALKKARDLHKGVVGKIREAHRALIQVLASTRGLSVPSSPSPTPSASAVPSASPTE